MKHKHADIIHAWADGAEIQVKSTVIRDWINIPSGSVPTWEDDCEYRIKPEENKPVVRWLWVGDDGWFNTRLYSEEEAKNMGRKKLEWSRTEFSE